MSSNTLSAATGSTAEMMEANSRFSCRDVKQTAPDWFDDSLIKIAYDWQLSPATDWAGDPVSTSRWTLCSRWREGRTWWQTGLLIHTHTHFRYIVWNVCVSYFHSSDQQQRPVSVLLQVKYETGSPVYWRFIEHAPFSLDGSVSVRRLSTVFEITAVLLLLLSVVLTSDRTLRIMAATSCVRCFCGFWRRHLVIIWEASWSRTRSSSILIKMNIKVWKSVISVCQIHI